MVRNLDEADLLKEVGVEHALVHRTVTEHFDDWPQSGRHQPRIEEFGHIVGSSEGFQRPHAASDQICHDGGDQAVRQPVGTVSGFHADGGEQDGVGADRPGRKPAGPRHGAGGA